LKISEKRGTVKISSTARNYETNFIFTIPDFYPADPVEFRIQKSNFPDRYIGLFSRQANVLREKLSLGFDEKFAFREVDANEGKKKKKVEELSTAMDNNAVVSLRDDLRLLSHISDLRSRGTEDNSARKELKTINRFGMKQVQRELAKINAEQQRLEQLENTREPKNSLLPTVKYLVGCCFQELVWEQCQVCGKRVVPKDPKKLKAMENNEKYINTEKYPQRSNCGHWFHHACMDEFISNPPFAKPCEICGVRVTNNLWIDDVRTLEKSWATRQAYERDVDDIAEFLDGF